MRSMCSMLGRGVALQTRAVTRAHLHEERFVPDFAAVTGKHAIGSYRKLLHVSMSVARCVGSRGSRAEAIMEIRVPEPWTWTFMLGKRAVRSVMC